jgi:hypothetical protein
LYLYVQHVFLNGQILSILSVAASLTSTDSGWVVGQLGASCDAVCEQFSEPCHLESILGVNTSVSFNRAVSQLGVPNMCRSYSKPSLSFAPAISDDNCAVVTKKVSSCSGSSSDHARLCCCRLDGCDSNLKVPWADTAIRVLEPLAYWPFDS